MGKIKIGPYLIVALAVLMIIIWFVVRQGTLTFEDYNDATYSLGQIAGLVGFTIFSLTFLMTTRLKILEKLFGGLDKVYRTHHIMGASAFVLLLFHPFLLVLNLVPQNFKAAATYLLPGSSWPINFGIIALLSMTVLIILTLYIKMKYQNWKISHKFMGVVYIVVMFHIFLVTTDISRYALLKGYVVLLACTGLISYAYGSWLRKTINEAAKYTVDSIKKMGRITVLTLAPNGEGLKFKAGQFAYLKFANSGVGKEQHPFTIASSPEEGKIKFAIKELGDYTLKIGEIKTGDAVEVEGPYGAFDGLGRKDGRSQVWVAGGIGVTPFLAMIEHLGKSKMAHAPTWFFYCTNNEEEAVFLNEVRANTKGLKEFKLITWFSAEKGRISVEGMEKSGAPMDSEFLICGPAPMMESLEGQLKKKGVKKSRIHMENFNIK